jgi:hypothetical protein
VRDFLGGSGDLRAIIIFVFVNDTFFQLQLLDAKMREAEAKKRQQELQRMEEERLR